MGGGGGWLEQFGDELFIIIALWTALCLLFGVMAFVAEQLEKRWPLNNRKF